MKMAESRLEAGRNFANKIWNASRFVIRGLSPEVRGPLSFWISRDNSLIPIGATKNLEGGRNPVLYTDLPLEDRWILSRLNHTAIDASKLMKDFQFGEALRQIYEFLWGEFCDWYIEITKIRLRDEKAFSPLPVLVHILETSLRLLHPYLPFITEELWQTLNERLPDDKNRPESIMIAPYPAGDEKVFDPQAERVIASLIEIIHSMRNARAENKVESNKFIEARVYAGDLAPSLMPYHQTIQTLSQARPLELLDSRHQGASDDNELLLVLKDVEIVIPLASMVDMQAEKARLQKELEEVKTNVDRLELRLKDATFAAKAPAAIVQKERDRLTASRDKLARLNQQLARFK
jgi:valyl-tRNA synthetase